MKQSCQILTDLIVSYFFSMVKFRTGTEKMRHFFFLSATLTTVSADRGLFHQIYCVQICCYRRGLPGKVL